MTQSKGRSGACAIVGRPNVGKSTLLNALVGHKLAIATPRPQTTRTNVLGIHASDDPPTQIAFVDTPGLTRPRSALERAVAEQAKAAFSNVDVVAFVTTPTSDSNAERAEREDAAVLELAKECGKPIILAINKVDRLRDKSTLLPLIERWHARAPFAAVVPISALSGTNLDALVGEIRTHLDEGLRYDPELLSDKPERFFVAELVREAVIAHTRQEIPHGVAVLIDDFAEEPKLTRIAATIVVEKPAHKRIVIGTKGMQLKEIGTEARKEIESWLQRKVFLELWVKVVERWTRHPGRVAELVGSETARSE